MYHGSWRLTSLVLRCLLEMCHKQGIAYFSSLSFCRGSRVTFFCPIFFLNKCEQMAREHLLVVRWEGGEGGGIEKSSGTSQFVFEELHL